MVERFVVGREVCSIYRGEMEGDRCGQIGTLLVHAFLIIIPTWGNLQMDCLFFWCRRWPIPQVKKRIEGWKMWERGESLKIVDMEMRWRKQLGNIEGQLKCKARVSTIIKNKNWLKSGRPGVYGSSHPQLFDLLYQHPLGGRISVWGEVHCMSIWMSSLRSGSLYGISMSYALNTVLGK